jgi:hypothetical protein
VRKHNRKASDISEAKRAEIVDLRPRHAGIGRPSKYKPQFADQVGYLCDRGLTDPEIAEFFGVALSTFNLWRAVHPEFSAAVKNGKDSCDERVERSLYQRATGYNRVVSKVVVVDGAPEVVEHMERVLPDTLAQIFWLKNRRPFEWRDRRDPVDVRVRTVRSMSTAEILEQLAALDAEEQRALPAPAKSAALSVSPSKSRDE